MTLARPPVPVPVPVLGAGAGARLAGLAVGLSGSA